MFPSPYGVSFILICLSGTVGKSKSIWFPSPYGVSFILIVCNAVVSFMEENGFPSPYGVSFILMRKYYKKHTMSL